MDGSSYQHKFYEIPLTPVLETPESDISEVTQRFPDSIFDPMEENKAPSTEHEISFSKFERQLLSPLRSSQSPKPEQEGRVTRSKRRTGSNKNSLPQEGVGSAGVVESRRKPPKRPRKFSKGTQVMPEMLAQPKTRAPRKTKTRDPNGKENVPPSEAPTSSATKDSEKEAEGAEYLKDDITKAPKKTRKATMTKGNQTSIISQSSLSSERSERTNVDNTFSSNVTSREISRTPRSSSPILSSHMSLNADSIASSECSNNGAPPTMFNQSGRENRISSSSVEENFQDGSQIPRSRRSLKEVLESTSALQGPIAVSENRSTPMSGLTIQIPPGAASLDIKVSNGEILINSKHDYKQAINKNGKKQSNRRQKPKWGSRSHKNCSESSDSSDVCCSCSSCEYSDSNSCSTCDSTSSSGCGCRHCRC